jgi:hypothetical protein
VHVAAPFATHASAQVNSRNSHYQAILASTRPQERYCAVTASTMFRRLPTVALSEGLVIPNQPVHLW